MRVWSIAAATTAHAAVIVILLVIPARKQPATEAFEGDVELEIETAIETPTEPVPSVTAIAPTPAPVEQAGGGHAREAIAATSTEQAGGGRTHDVVPAASGSAEPAPTAQIFAMSPADLGIGGTNPFLPRRDDSPPPDAKKNTVLRDSLRARDMSLGLGPQGPVVEALRDAAYSSIAPENGKAIFEIHAGEGGVITLVDLVSTEGYGWSDTQRVAREKLAKVLLVLPSGSKGAVLRVEVVSKFQLPNGQRAGGSSWGTRSADETDNRSPAVLIPDPSNLGAKPRRVINTHVVSGSIF